MDAARRAWQIVARRYRDVFPDGNPFVGLERVRTGGTVAPATREEAYRLAEALRDMGHAGLGAAALICFEWLQRPENVLAGWITTEVGRQPWTVYGVLRTADSASPLDAAAVGSSLVAFFVIYLLVFGTGTLYTLRLMSKPPAAGIDDNIGPTRSAGITPAAAVDAALVIKPKDLGS